MTLTTCFDVEYDVRNITGDEEMSNDEDRSYRELRVLRRRDRSHDEQRL